MDYDSEDSLDEEEGGSREPTSPDRQDVMSQERTYPGHGSGKSAVPCKRKRKIGAPKGETIRYNRDPPPAIENTEKGK